MMRILVPLDGSSAAEQALKHAAAIALTFPSEITVLRVIVEPVEGIDVRMDSVDYALWRHQAQAYLESIVDRDSASDLSIRCEVAEGSPAETIIRYMTANKTDLVILTRYGGGSAENFATGGTAQKVVSSSACSVLLLDPRKPVDSDHSYNRLLVPVDESKKSDCAVAVGAMIAEIHDASLLLLYAIEEPRLPDSMPATKHARYLATEMQRIIRIEAKRRLCGLATTIPQGIRVETSILMSSDVPFAIESMAEDRNIDLLLLHAADSESESGCGLGPICHSLIQYSHRPLFVLRPSAGEGFMSKFRSVYLDESQLEAG